MKIDKKGNILEAARSEIVRHYYMGDLKDMLTLEEYFALLKYQGTKILDDREEGERDA